MLLPVLGPCLVRAWAALGADLIAIARVGQVRAREHQRRQVRVIAMGQLHPEQSPVRFLVTDVDEAVLDLLEQLCVPPQVAFLEPVTILVHPCVLWQDSIEDLRGLRTQLLDTQGRAGAAASSGTETRPGGRSPSPPRG